MRKTERPGMTDSPAYPMSFAGGCFELLGHRERSGAVDFKLRIGQGSELVPLRLLDAIASVRPTLREHACTADDTGSPMTLPHLIEHVAIDLLVEQRGGGDEPVAGYTAWLDRRGGIARITLSSTDGEATRGAMLAACALVAQYSEDV